MSVRTVSKWLGSFPRRGRARGCSIAPRRRCRAASHAGGAGRGDRGAAPLADDRGGDRGDAGDAVVDRLGGADPDRARASSRGSSRRSRRTATSVQPPGELVHIDVKKLGRIGRPGHRVNGDRAHPQPRASAGSSSTSASTTRPGSPTSRCSTTRKPPPRSASCAARSPTTRAHGIRVERVLTDNGSCYRAIVHALACTDARDQAPAAPGPTGRAPTARPNASSAPCSAAGPTAPSTATQTNAAPLSPAGSTSTDESQAGRIGPPLREWSWARVTRELKRRTWGCVLPRCLAA